MTTTLLVSLGILSSFEVRLGEQSQRLDEEAGDGTGTLRRTMAASIDETSGIPPSWACPILRSTDQVLAIVELNFSPCHRTLTSLGRIKGTPCQVLVMLA
jgi:hypothetical protein